MSISTRLRFVSSPSPEGLTAFLNNLPFKVEIKSIAPNGNRWFCWFVLPDNITHKELDKSDKGIVDIPSLNLED